MNAKLRKSILNSLVIVAATCLPWAANSQSGWTSYALVEEIYPTSAGTFYVKINFASNPHSCATTEGWFSNSGTEPGAPLVYATLLSAQVKEKHVRLHVTGACDQWGYYVFSSVSMANF